jgi:hypothetical protein
VNAAGNVSITGLGIGIQALSSFGSTFLTATGPVSLSDPYSGNIIIEGINNGVSGGVGVNVTGTANGSIFVPTIVAQTGSISLTAGQDIDVLTLTAGANISTTSVNGVTNIVTATSNGAISITGGQTITFRQITAGGAGGNVNLVSTGGFVLGIPSLTATDYQVVSTNRAIDGSIVAGGTVNIMAPGIGILNVRAAGVTTMNATGFIYTPTYQGPQLIGLEPDLINAVTNLWNAQASSDTAALTSFNAASGYLTHGSASSLSSAPLNFTFLTRTLTEVTAGLLTLSPAAPPPAPTEHIGLTWQAAVIFAYTNPPRGTTSGPIPYPWTLFDPSTARKNPRRASTEWWAGGLDFQPPASDNSITDAGSIINAYSVTVDATGSVTGKGSIIMTADSGLTDQSDATAAIESNAGAKLFCDHLVRQGVSVSCE